jgi:hypothetical protein
VQTWTSLLVWLTHDRTYPTGDLVTSVAIPGLPHCTFLSHKALRHIPPQEIFPVASPYALAENLYHEALHQELSATLRWLPSFDGYSAHDLPTLIDIPWRGAKWPHDRVLHAAWIYARLIPFRKLALADEALDPEVRASISASLIQAESALGYLANALEQEVDMFGRDAQAFLLRTIQEAKTVSDG